MLRSAGKRARDFISTVTDSVLEAVGVAESALERSYPVVYFDALRVKIRDEGKREEQGGLPGSRHRGRRDQGRAGHLDQAERGSQILAQGHERAAQPRSGRHPDRGGRRAQGLSGSHHHGFSIGQRADLHRASEPYCLSFCGWKERQALARELKAIYRAETAKAAAKRLSEFEAGPWGKKYPMIVESWRRNWQQIIPFYGYPPEVRKIIYTTNAIESLHMQLRKMLKNRDTSRATRRPLSSFIWPCETSPNLGKIHR